MSIYDETKFLMNKYDVHPNKKLGQNFLFDENSLNNIVDGVTKDDVVVEIGPGLGNLTAMLVERAKKVVAVELDTNMIPILKERFMLYDNIEIINDDILKIDIDKIAPNAKVVANLPYYITTQIITNLLKTNIKNITILIQKEVAERICAEPGSKLAGAITYFANYYADCSIVDYVGKECFIPSPEVESAIVRMERLNKPRVNVKNEEVFFKLIKENFCKRRKTILNSIGNVAEKEKLVQILNKLGISQSARGETFTLQQFADISNELQ